MHLSLRPEDIPILHSWRDGYAYRCRLPQKALAAAFGAGEKSGFTGAPAGFCFPPRQCGEGEELNCHHERASI